MNINTLSSLLPSFLLPLGGNTAGAAGNVNQAASSLPQDGAPDISPVARFLSKLQQLQQQDPTRFQQVASRIAHRLRQAAKIAECHGNPTWAEQLNKLADQFQNAANGGQIPASEALQQAGLSWHHHHGGHGGHHGSPGRPTDLSIAFQPPTIDPDSQNLLTSILDSSTNDGTSPSVHDA